MAARALEQLAGRVAEQVERVLDLSARSAGESAIASCVGGIPRPQVIEMVHVSNGSVL
jgi:hypothetical protein